MTLPSIVSGVDAFQRSASYLQNAAEELRTGGRGAQVSAEIGGWSMTAGRDALRDTLAVLGKPTSNPLVLQLGKEIQTVGGLVAAIGARGNTANIVNGLQEAAAQALQGVAALHNLVEPTPKYHSAPTLGPAHS